MQEQTAPPQPIRAAANRGGRRAWLGRILGPSGLLSRAVPLLNLLYMLWCLAIAHLLGPLAQSMPWVNQAGLPAYASLALLALLVSAALIWREQHPAAVFAVQAVAFACGAVAFRLRGNSTADFLILPLLIALYALMLNAALWQGFIGALTSWLLLMAYMDYSLPLGMLVSMTIQMGLYAVVTAAAALVVRFQREARRATSLQEQERERSRAAVRARDRAVLRARVTTELHDSVGHGLTTIIALSEGLQGQGSNAQTDRALAGINEVARDCLDQTRQAVKLLAQDESLSFHVADRALDAATDTAADTAHKTLDTALDTGTGIEEGVSLSPGAAPSSTAAQRPLHDWDDITPALAHVRALGIALAFTETGKRHRSDRVQADCCYWVSLEALTNAIRHGRSVSQITLAWDYQSDGSMVVRIWDNGQPPAGPTGPAGAAPASSSGESGMGLAMCAQRVQALGGRLTYGFTPVGWRVQAWIPACEPEPHPAPHPNPNPNPNPQQPTTSKERAQ
ncbi:hypothetical protein KIM372_01640 [Bombiscardovia nodaiensis]|uniref:histidine kinase n=1 Tax=Bombiscardovia nodaiensis TaxID=2932181 RepID=A0ABM8B602_9BIFI|nr:hypothetical protein KIM372_01640 [Bombiscardovia nodaiensis]